MTSEKFFPYYWVHVYCSSVWRQIDHVRLVDTQINGTMRLITGTIKCTPHSHGYISQIQMCLVTSLHNHLIAEGRNLVTSSEYDSGAIYHTINEFPIRMFPRWTFRMNLQTMQQHILAINLYKTMYCKKHLYE